MKALLTVMLSICFLSACCRPYIAYDMGSTFGWHSGIDAYSFLDGGNKDSYYNVFNGDIKNEDGYYSGYPAKKIKLFHHGA
uniref:Lipoprotein n=1 Tax=Steinernema glaseri TaxID=37863 RepID=A0A1I8AK58_9BILA